MELDVTLSIKLIVPRIPLSLIFFSAWESDLSFEFNRTND